MIGLERTLQSIGMSCFVKYYHLWSGDRVDAIETLKAETDYTENSCSSRTGHAQSILRAGRGADALRLIIRSNAAQATRDRAQELLS